VKTVWIKNAQCATEVFVPDARKNLLLKNLIGVSAIQVNVLHTRGLSLQRIHFALFDVDQVEFFKGWLNFERIERAAFDDFPCSFSYVRAGTSEAIDVDGVQVPRS
jgi:hypothetical protein